MLFKSLELITIAIIIYINDIIIIIIIFNQEGFILETKTLKLIYKFYSVFLFYN